MCTALQFARGGETGADLRAVDCRAQEPFPRRRGRRERDRAGGSFASGRGLGSRTRKWQFCVLEMCADPGQGIGPFPKNVALRPKMLVRKRDCSLARTTLGDLRERGEAADGSARVREVSVQLNEGGFGDGGKSLRGERRRAGVAD